MSPEIIPDPPRPTSMNSSSSTPQLPSAVTEHSKNRGVFFAVAVLCLAIGAIGGVIGFSVFKKPDSFAQKTSISPVASPTQERSPVSGIDPASRSVTGILYEGVLQETQNTSSGLELKMNIADAPPFLVTDQTQVLLASSQLIATPSSTLALKPGDHLRITVRFVSNNWETIQVKILDQIPTPNL